MGRVRVWARPSSRQEGIEWDAWRKRWVISVREPPAGGRANEAIVRVIAEQLNVPRPSVRVITGSQTRGKRVEVDGILDSEIAARLRGRRQPPPSTGG